MIDYQAWVKSAKKFLAGLHRLSGRINVDHHFSPPLSIETIDKLSHNLRIPIPEPISLFLSTGSSHCNINYCWHPPENLFPLLNVILSRKNYIPGGASLVNSAKLDRMQQNCTTWVSGWMEGNPDKAMWLRSFPFLDVGNGDLIALDTSIDPINPPVVYLCHEEGDENSCVIASDFKKFIGDWLDLCFINPALWLLEELCLRPNPFLRPHPVKVATLRKLFAEARRSDTGPSVLKFPDPA